MGNTNDEQRNEQRKQKARERVTRWRAEHPEQVRVLQLRHYRKALRAAGFTVEGGNVDLDGGRLNGEKGGADNDR